MAPSLNDHASSPRLLAAAHPLPLSNLIHGYASLPDCGRLVNTFHLALAALHCRAWLEWVPSKANISDLPSRDDDVALLDALDAAHLGDMLSGFVSDRE